MAKVIASRIQEYNNSLVAWQKKFAARSLAGAVAIACLLPGLLFTSPGYAAIYALSSEEWARPRSGRSIAQLTSVKALVERWMQSPKSVIEIRYPGGESGTLWAFELRDWLVTLGIPSDSIATHSGSASGDELIMQITQN
jgi:hypothetical protein